MTNKNMTKLVLMWVSFLREWNENSGNEVKLDDEIRTKKPQFYDFMNWYAGNVDKFLDK